MAEFASLVPFAIESLPQYLREQIGIFGWLDTQMPLIGYWLWTTAIGLLLSCAVLVGTRRHRVILVTLSLLSVVVFVVIAAAGVLPLGYNLQGRHVHRRLPCAFRSSPPR